MTRQQAQEEIRRLSIIERTYKGILFAEDAIKQINDLVNPIEFFELIPVEKLRELAIQHMKDEIVNLEIKLKELKS